MRSTLWIKLSVVICLLEGRPEFDSSVSFPEVNFIVHRKRSGCASHGEASNKKLKDSMDPLQEEVRALKE
jgi:hypothetical protein